MTATAPISWPELVYDAQITGRLPVVIPTGSAPLVGCFQPLPHFAAPFLFALNSRDRELRCRAITAALMSSRVDQGLPW